MTLAGVTLAPDEVEIQATPATGHGRGRRRRPRRGHRHRAHARSCGPRATRASCSARSRTCDATPASALDDRIDLWVEGLPAAVAAHLDGVAARDAGHARRRPRPGRRRRPRDRRARERPGRHRLAPSRRRRVGSWPRRVPTREAIAGARGRDGHHGRTARGRGRRDAGPHASPPDGRSSSASRSAVVVLDQLTRPGSSHRSTRARRSSSSATTCASIFSQNSARSSGSSATRRSCSGRVARRRVADRLVPRPVGPEPLPLDRARAAARRRARQPDRPVPPRLRRRLDRHGHRQPAVLDTSTSPTPPSAPRSSCSS